MFRCPTIGPSCLLSYSVYWQPVPTGWAAVSDKIGRWNTFQMFTLVGGRGTAVGEAGEGKAGVGELGAGAKEPNTMSLSTGTLFCDCCGCNPLTTIFTKMYCMQCAF